MKGHVHGCVSDLLKNGDVRELGSHDHITCLQVFRGGADKPDQIGIENIFAWKDQKVTQGFFDMEFAGRCF